MRTQAPSVRAAIRLVLIVGFVIWLAQMAGCATYGPESTYRTRSAAIAEQVWLGVHGLDTAQTVTIARTPECLWEDEPAAVAVYGTKHPSESRVLATNALLGTLHYYVGGWLDRRTEMAIDQDSPSRGAWYVTRAAFFGISLVASSRAVINNRGLGIKPFSKHPCRW